MLIASLAWCGAILLLTGAGAIDTIRIAIPDTRSSPGTAPRQFRSGEEISQLRLSADGLVLGFDVVQATFYGLGRHDAIAGLPKAVPHAGIPSIFQVAWGENFTIGMGRMQGESATIVGTPYTMFYVKESHHGVEAVFLLAIAPGLLGVLAFRRRKDDPGTASLKI